MANKQSNTSLGDNAMQITNEVATLSVASPGSCLAIENPSAKHADLALSPAQDTKDSALTPNVQSTPTRPLSNTRESRIITFRRAIRKNLFPDHRANLEALIRYYEDGGKVPEGDEEVWAVDGEVSFGTRNYRSFEQMPEGWLTKTKLLNVSSLYLYWIQGLLTTSYFVSLLNFHLLSL